MRKALLPFLIVLFANYASAGEMYKWTDKKGVVHLSDINSNGNKSTKTIDMNETPKPPPLTDHKEKLTRRKELIQKFDARNKSLKQLGQPEMPYSVLVNRMSVEGVWDLGERKMVKDVNSRWRYIDTKELVFPNITSSKSN